MSLLQTWRVVVDARFCERVEYRLSLKTKNWQEAKKKEKETLAEIAEGNLAAKARLPDRLSTRRQIPTSRNVNCTRQKNPLHGPRKKPSAEAILWRHTIAADHTRKDCSIPDNRKAAGVSGRTINMEVGLLRRILKKHRQWGRLAGRCEDATRET